MSNVSEDIIAAIADRVLDFIRHNAHHSCSEQKKQMYVGLVVRDIKIKNKDLKIKTPHYVLGFRQRTFERNIQVKD